MGLFDSESSSDGTVVPYLSDRADRLERLGWLVMFVGFVVSLIAQSRIPAAVSVVVGLPLILPFHFGHVRRWIGSDRPELAVLFAGIGVGIIIGLVGLILQRWSVLRIGGWVFIGSLGVVSVYVGFWGLQLRYYDLALLHGLVAVSMGVSGWGLYQNDPLVVVGGLAAMFVLGELITRTLQQDDTPSSEGA